MNSAFRIMQQSLHLCNHSFPSLNLGQQTRFHRCFHAYAGKLIPDYICIRNADKFGSINALHVPHHFFPEVVPGGKLPFAVRGKAIIQFVIELEILHISGGQRQLAKAVTDGSEPVIAGVDFVDRLPAHDIAVHAGMEVDNTVICLPRVTTDEVLKTDFHDSLPFVF